VQEVQQCERGFTLLEMLLVLFIIGLIVGLTAPRLGAGIDRYELTAQRQDLEDQLRQLPRRVRLAGRSLELPRDAKLANLGDGNPVLVIQPEWSVTFTPSLVISRMGACSKTEVHLQSSKDSTISMRYKLAELSCELLPIAP
jgi:prepilin-type N-terminal cleavage/methylation domain-containing protein